MNSKNNSEKRSRQKRMAARKRRERSAYRAKYMEQNRQEDELSEHNQKLESGMKNAEIWLVCIFIWTFGVIPCLIFFVNLWSESFFLNTFLAILFVGSAYLGMQILANYISRCRFYLTLGERPDMPMKVRIPSYYVDREERIMVEDIFEEINKAKVFTYCNSRQIVITNDSYGGDWIFSGIFTLILLSMLLWFKDDFWTAGGSPVLLFGLVTLILTILLFYIYTRKKTFIIDRETKMITIPPVCCLGRSKIFPWQQVVVAYRQGLILNDGIRHRGGTRAKDYLSLTAKENLPYGSSLGFRCDSGTQYRFARLICEYMNVEDVDDLPDIEGFEDVIARIKENKE